jgi:hypothetical protein
MVLYTLHHSLLMEVFHPYEFDREQQSEKVIDWRNDCKDGN